MAKSGMLAAMRATCRKPPSRAVRDEQLFDRPETRPLAPADLRGRHRQPEPWPTREQRLQGAHAFDAGKLMAKAEMDPGAEGEVPVRPALKVEPFGCWFACGSILAAATMAMILSPRFTWM